MTTNATPNSSAALPCRQLPRPVHVLFALNGECSDVTLLIFVRDCRDNRITIAEQDNNCTDVTVAMGQRVNFTIQQFFGFAP